tara:strand:- start:975 stop:1301 length:327 start_codon:yes stop_codon:yes gene_type:complete
MKLKHISVEIRIIISLLFFILSNISFFSQTNLQKPSPLIFVEGGERKTFSSVEENIKSFGLDHTNSMILAYDSKMSSIDTNDINSKIWVKRIKYELVLLRRRKLELTN